MVKLHWRMVVFLAASVATTLTVWRPAERFRAVKRSRSVPPLYEKTFALPSTKSYMSPLARFVKLSLTVACIFWVRRKLAEFGLGEIGVMAGLAASTVHARCAGETSTLPAPSVAFMRNVCLP